MQSKAVAVTGGFGALGRAVAARAAAAGGRVAALDLAAAPADMATLLGPKGLALGGVDLGTPESAAAAFAQVNGRLGGLDVLVNVAGGFRWETLEAGEASSWEAMHRINLATAVNASRAALPLLRASAAGAIVNIGAGAALRAGAGMGPYAAAKSGVHRFTEALAEELKGSITVNAVLPSIIDTPSNRRDMPDADFAKWVQPDDLADIILFLAGARAVTGALIPVTGGL